MYLVTLYINGDSNQSYVLQGRTRASLLKKARAFAKKNVWGIMVQKPDWTYVLIDFVESDRTYEIEIRDRDGEYTGTDEFGLTEERALELFDADIDQAVYTSYGRRPLGN